MQKGAWLLTADKGYRIVYLKLCFVFFISIDLLVSQPVMEVVEKKPRKKKKRRPPTSHVSTFEGKYNVGVVNKGGFPLHGMDGKR